MLQQTLTRAVGLLIGTGARLDVVIHLDIADAVFIDHAVDHPLGIVPNLRIAEIELIAPLIAHTPAVPHEEPAVRKLLCQRTVDAHDFQLQPCAWDHARVAYGIHDLFEAARKALFRGAPLTDAVPPCAVRIPSAVYDKVFASCFPRLRNHFQFLLRRGVTGQAVHIVIENDR